MSGWIDWTAVGKILGVGLLAGAGLPAIFAIGLRLVTPASTHTGTPSGIQPAGAAGATVQAQSGASARTAPPALIAGVLCFAVVLAAIGYGIYIIVNG